MSNKLNRLVAERVMGWKRDTAPRGTRIYLTNDHGGWVPVDAFNPSTSIADAWQVVVKMRARDSERPNVVIITMADVRCVSINRLKDWQPLGRSEHDDECMAITLAALRACGVSEAEITEALR